jgi:NAD(P)-dependent dehydrogenase (short-subunit alcohol dehydrogenase family)
MDLPKTTAFVSGANRGLGKHLADQLTSRGAGVQYGDARAYLTATRAAAEADGPNRYLVTAFPATAAPPCSTCRTNSLTRAIADA